MACGCGKRTAKDLRPRPPGAVPSAESFAASAQPRYMVVARQTSSTGTRFTTLTAAQDYARRTGGIVRQL